MKAGAVNVDLPDEVLRKGRSCPAQAGLEAPRTVNTYLPRIDAFVHLPVTGAIPPEPRLNRRAPVMAWYGQNAPKEFFPSGMV